MLFLLILNFNSKLDRVLWACAKNSALECVMTNDGWKYSQFIAKVLSSLVVFSLISVAPI